jgi:mono/diheme cytochrome c family protein
MKALFGVVLLLAAAVGLADFLPQAISSPVFADSAQTSGASPAHVSPGSAGAQEYAAHCAICHGDQREGILPGFPPLIGVRRQLSDAQIIAIVHNGKGRMPAFPSLGERDLASLLEFLSTNDLPAAAAAAAGQGTAAPAGSTQLDAGKALFERNCAFCHGRDATGGESGPDLTRSKIVLADVNGDQISQVVRNGRPGGMPAFNFSGPEILSLATFIHAEQTIARTSAGERKGVDVSDLQTGNAEAGKVYFNGAGGCSKCHSPAGDLAGVASRYEGLALEERMLYPRHTISHVTVTEPSGKTITGTLAYEDEFTIGLRDANGTYHSWQVKDVKFKVDSPVNAHVEQFSKYTDADIHNLMAYIQTLR